MVLNGSDKKGTIFTKSRGNDRSGDLGGDRVNERTLNRHKRPVDDFVRLIIRVVHLFTDVHHGGLEMDLR